MGKLEIDFYKALKLPQPVVCGLVNRITSPKGVRRLNARDEYEYRLKSDLVQIYEGKPVNVISGLYWVLDIHKVNGNLKWNHYLVVVRDGSFFPVAEFRECIDSTWIKEAMPYIKTYFEDGDLSAIQVTTHEPPKRAKSGRNRA